MKKIIVVAGATGNLGERIVRALLQQGAEVRAVLRSGATAEKINHLEQLGAKVYTVDMSKVEEISPVCQGADCVVSALAGLREVIIDAQKILLDAAVAAGVPRFIPSDYSIDFTRFSAGENRNLDWRREFHMYLDKAPIAATSIFNGAFADMLTGQMPLIMFKQKMVLFWGKADHPMIFTTVDDTATFTAYAALDADTPRALHIAGDLPSPRALQALMQDLTGEKHRLFRAGGPGLLGIIIKLARRFAPGETELYPAWQGMQYMRNMIDERSLLEKLDNKRYPAIRWTTVKELLTKHLAGV